MIVQISKECDECLACILVNSMDLLRLDLDGVQMLVPCIIEALEIVLPDKDLKLKLVVFILLNPLNLLFTCFSLPLAAHPFALTCSAHPTDLLPTLLFLFFFIKNNIRLYYSVLYWTITTLRWKFVFDVMVRCKMVCIAADERQNVLFTSFK